MGAHYYKEQIFDFPISTALVRFVSWATKIFLFTNNFSPAIHKVKVAQSCPTLCDPMSMKFSRPEYWSGYFGMLEILESVAFPFSRRSSQPRD